MTQEEIKNNIAIKGRLKYITNEQDRKIAEFIIDYSFKDRQEIYTNGTILVPLYRVLDALIQKGEPYSEG
jgi:hypothetical protein